MSKPKAAPIVKQRNHNTVKPPLHSPSCGAAFSVTVLAACSGVFISDLILNQVHAQTVTQARLNATKRLIPMEKVTVGPDDQYQGVVEVQANKLVFTRKVDLAPHLGIQDLATGVVTDFVPPHADSQEAAILSAGSGASGKKVAFTYFKYHSRGDICYRTFESPSIECIKSGEGEKDTPFWRGENEIGYLLGDPTSDQKRIIFHSLTTNTSRTIAQGKIWQPFSRPESKYLTYNEWVDSKPGVTRANGQSANKQPAKVMVLKDLATSSTYRIELALPGISGFPIVSQDDQTLYFSHYLNDTNSDNVIDGNDNSILFRLPIQKILEAKPGTLLHPEPLTSVESNCSYPRPTATHLYATCGIGGTLAVYRLPLTGVVPTDWDSKILWNAHQTARSPSDRILLLNTIKYRFPAFNDWETSLRLFSNHLVSDDMASARYYLSQMEAAQAPFVDLEAKGTTPGSQASPLADRKTFFKLLGLWIDGREKKKSQPSEEVSRSFQKAIQQLDVDAALCKGYPRLKALIRGELKTFLEQPDAAGTFLKQVKLTATTQVHPLERYFYHRLAHWIAKRKAQPELEDQLYLEMLLAPELSHENRVYYAFRMLQSFKDRGLTPAQRVEKVKQILESRSTEFKGIDPSIVHLLTAEQISLRIGLASKPAEKSAIYRELDAVMVETSKDYFLRKALYIRAILTLADSLDFLQLGFVASNWLKYSTPQGTEFIFARTGFSEMNLDRAYDALAQANFQLSSNYFFTSLSFTDDLESHVGFISTMLDRNKRDEISKTYDQMRDRKMIGDNLKFVEAFLILVDATPKSTDDVSYLDQAIARLEAMEQDRNSPTRYLLLGYCQLEKLLRLANSYDFPRDLYDSAYRSLSLALELARDQVRIQASALSNLGTLQLRVQNYGLAAKYLLKRRALGFTSEREEIAVRWALARALFYGDRPKESATEIQAALKALSRLSAPSPEDRAYLQERLAFYLQAASQWKEADAAYQELEKQVSNLPAPSKAIFNSEINLAKRSLSRGLIHLKLGNFGFAQEEFKKSEKLAQKLPVLEAKASRLIPFDPKRIEVAALGFLARITPATSERKAYAERHFNLLKSAQKLLDESDSLLILNRLTSADRLEKDSPQEAAQLVSQALDLALAQAKDGEGLSYAVYQGVLAYLTSSIRAPNYYKMLDGTRARQTLDAMFKLYDQQTSEQPQLEYQRVQLELLWAGSVAALKGARLDFEAAKQLLDSGAAKKVESLLPSRWKDLTTLANLLSGRTTS